MFPLKERKLIRGCEAHINAGLGCATDYEAIYQPLFAPFKGKVKHWSGRQGGNWLTLIRPNGDRLQFAHLSEYNTLGEVEEGDLIAVTGNTGKRTTGPHLHIQIKDKNGNRLDPEKYNWETTMILAKDETNKIWMLPGDHRYWILDPPTLKRGIDSLWPGWDKVVSMTSAELANYEYRGAIFISNTDDPLQLNLYNHEKT